MVAGFEDPGEREQDAARQIRERSEDDCAQCGEPPGRESGEEQDEKFITGDGQPVDDDIEAARSGAPFGYDEEGVKRR